MTPPSKIGHYQKLYIYQNNISDMTKNVDLKVMFVLMAQHGSLHQFLSPQLIFKQKYKYKCNKKL